MKYGPEKCYVHMYIDRKLMDRFRKHCKEHGLVLSQTVSVLLEAYLNEKVK